MKTSASDPRPPIIMNKIDPEYRATQRHVADLYERYAAPLIVLDLVKQKEKTRRECIIGEAYAKAVKYVNKLLPEDRLKIVYWAVDFSNMSKSSKKGKRASTPATAASAGNTGNTGNTDNTGNTGNAANAAAARTSVKFKLRRPDSQSWAAAGSAGEGGPAGEGGIGRDSSSADGARPPMPERGGRQVVLRELHRRAQDTLDQTGFFASFPEDIAIKATKKGMSTTRGETKQGGAAAAKAFQTEVEHAGKKVAAGDGGAHNGGGKGVEKDEDGRRYWHQRGILRVNCVDCLDRTNVAQFCVGMGALGRQLNKMGLCEVDRLDPSSEVVQLLMVLYENMGDSIALQYVEEKRGDNVPAHIRVQPRLVVCVHVFICVCMCMCMCACVP